MRFVGLNPTKRRENLRFLVASRKYFMLRSCQIDSLRCSESSSRPIDLSVLSSPEHGVPSVQFSEEAQYDLTIMSDSFSSGIYHTSFSCFLRHAVVRCLLLVKLTESEFGRALEVELLRSASVGLSSLIQVASRSQLVRAQRPRSNLLGTH